MDEGVIIVLDYEKICRLCLQARPTLSDIFERDEEVSLAEQIQVTTSVEMSMSDGLPRQVCHKCRYMVELSYELRSTVLKAHRLLMESTELPQSMQQPQEQDSEGAEYTNGEKLQLLLSQLKGEGEGEDEGAQDNQEGGEPLSQQQPPAPPKHLTCQLCLVPWKDRGELWQHVAEHYQGTRLEPYCSASKPFLCAQCGNKFNFKKDLIVHHRQHLNINPYTCQVQGCASDVRSKEALRHHMYSHAEKKFVCELCGSAFRRKFELGQHRTRHLDEGNQYRCGLCRVVCKNRLSFKAHLKHHETGRRFKCPRPGCPKAFFSNTDLLIHERSHSNNKCYKCPLCVCAYISQSQLNRHLRQHEKRRMNKCDKCSESFVDYAEFCNHRIRTHGEWHPHKCVGCNQGYQSSRQLSRHAARCRLAQRLQHLHNQGQLSSQDVSVEESELRADGSAAPEEDFAEEGQEELPEGGQEEQEQHQLGEQADTVVIHADDLHNLTADDKNFLYLDREEGAQQYMIIGDTEQFACKVELWDSTE